jgi:hypothetical protein
MDKETLAQKSKMDSQIHKGSCVTQLSATDKISKAGRGGNLKGGNFFGGLMVSVNVGWLHWF